MTSDISILIVARNAAATIERSVRSALRQDGPIVLVDDFSTDDTAALAKSIAGNRIRLVLPERSESIGVARQAGIDEVRTRYAMWVGAGDEVVPGRSDLLLARLEREGADLVYDTADLHDESTGAFVRHVPIPAYLRRDPTAVRQFERNVIPSLGSPLVRTSWAQRIGYDRTCQGVEDYDFLLRSCLEGARIAYEPTAGYRQFASPRSTDRRAAVRAALEKHDYNIMRARFGAAGYNSAITGWALVAVAFYREHWSAARRFLSEVEKTISDPRLILEPDGPCAHPEGWRLAFYRGTLELIAGNDDEAWAHLRAAYDLAATPETANNLGVALARMGRRSEAATLFAQAQHAFPDYLDASENLRSQSPSHITTHPLRPRCTGRLAGGPAGELRSSFCKSRRA
jgi:glycosyltransferase involved in cell wall biosynthesis